MNKGKDIRELKDELERQKKERYDVVVPSKLLTALYDENINEVLLDVPDLEGGDNKQYGITPYAHRQICIKTNIPAKYYDLMKEKKPELLVKNVNAWLPDKEKRMVRILDGNVRALLSSRYRIIDNYDILNQALMEFFNISNEKKTKIDIHNADLTDTHLYVKALSPDLIDEIHDTDNMKRGDVVNGGIMISNSEVGAGGYKVTPFINIVKCSNGLIGEEVLKKIHVGRDLGIGEINWSDETLRLQDEALWAKMKDMIHATFNPEIFHKWVDRINKVASVEIEKPTLAVNNIVKSYNMPDKLQADIMDFFAKENPTQWGLSNAVTSYAQTVGDYNKQIEMEKIGTKILEMKPDEVNILVEA
jgi:hypothetical protein